jgi:aminoglycoside 3-N-acetyltransferase I
MEYSIHRLKETDVSLLRGLNTLFGDVFEDANNYASNVPSDAYAAAFLSDTNHIVLVAMADEKIIGGLVAYTLTKFEMERKEVYVYDLAVSKTRQRSGVGRSLIGELVATAKSIGAYVVFVQADEGDDAIKFYESLHPDENIRTRNFDYLV